MEFLSAFFLLYFVASVLWIIHNLYSARKKKSTS